MDFCLELTGTFRNQMRSGYGLTNPSLRKCTYMYVIIVFLTE